MIADKYIPNASTPEEHLNNVFFQAGNVEGWLIVGQEDNALTKAECLLQAAQELVAVLKSSDATQPVRHGVISFAEFKRRCIHAQLSTPA